MCTLVVPLVSLWLCLQPKAWTHPARMKEFWMAGMGGWEGGWVGAWVGGWFSEWLSEKLSWWVVEWVVEQVSKQEMKQGGFREVGREDYRVSLRGHGGIVLQSLTALFINFGKHKHPRPYSASVVGCQDLHSLLTSTERRGLEPHPGTHPGHQPESLFVMTCPPRVAGVTTGRHTCWEVCIWPHEWSSLPGIRTRAERDHPDCESDAITTWPCLSPPIWWWWYWTNW